MFGLKEMAEDRKKGLKIEGKGNKNNCADPFSDDELAILRTNPPLATARIC